MTEKTSEKVEKKPAKRAKPSDPAKEKAREEKREEAKAARKKEREEAKAAKKAAREREREEAKAAKKAEEARAKEAQREAERARSKDEQAYPNCKQVHGHPPAFPHERAAQDSSLGPNALVRVAYRVGGCVDETVYMVRRGEGAVTRSDAHATGVALASRSEAVADGFWVSLRDSRHWQPTVHACRYAPRVADDVAAPEDDDPVDLVIPDRLSSTVEIAIWRWVVHKLLGAELGVGANWSARVPRSVAAMALACLKVTK